MFKFDKRYIERYIVFDFNLRDKFEESFEYIIGKIKPTKLIEDLNKIKSYESKNYNWFTIEKDNITLIIRKYGHHFTIYFKRNLENKYFTRKYGCFIFSCDSDLIPDDQYDENYFIYLNKYINDIISIINDNKVHSLCNPYTLKITENWVKVKNVWNGGENINNIEDLIFCLEEMFSIYTELFSQNEMFNEIQKYNVGDTLNNKKIIKINKTLINNYYHGVGVQFEDDSYLQDVYSLTRWYYKYFFPDSKKLEFIVK